MSENKIMENETQQEDFIMHPTVDFCFKELMANPEVRKGFIAAVFGIDPEKIEETKLLPTILEPEYADEKYGILDVHVSMKSGEQLDLEMQVVTTLYWFQRTVFYLSKMVTGQMKKGDSYSKLQPCIHIGILDYCFFKDDDRFYHHIGLCDKETGEISTNLLQMHIFELPKLPPESRNETDLTHWMRFFGGKRREDFAKMAEKDKYIDEAYKELEQLSADERKRLEYEAREKALRDHMMFVESAHEMARQAVEKEFAEARQKFEAEKNNFEAEKNNLEAEKNNLEAEKNNLEAEKNNLETEKNNLETERSNLELEKSNLAEKKQDFENERRSLAEEKQELKQEIAEAGDNGIQRMVELNQRLIKENRMDDLVKASADEAYRQQLFEELGI